MTARGVPPALYPVRGVCCLVGGGGGGGEDNLCPAQGEGEVVLPVLVLAEGVLGYP